MAKQIIVDDNDNIIGAKERSEITSQDTYRVSFLVVINSKKQVLFAMRAPTKRVLPSVWTVPVNGTLDEGETYEYNIVKETKEEIGIDLKKIIKGPKLHRDQPTGKIWMQMFFLFADLDPSKIKFDPSEITELKWFDRKQAFFEANNYPERFMPRYNELLVDIYNFVDSYNE